MIVDVTKTRNGKRKLCKLNPDINNAIFCMCAVESEGCLSLMHTFTDAEQKLCKVVMILKGYKDLPKLWGSRIVALQCDMHLGAGTAPLYRDGMEPFVSPFHRLWYLPLGGWGGKGYLHVKDGIKIVKVRGKIEGRIQGGWWIGLFLCWQKERGFLLLIRAQIFHKFLETLSYE